VSDTPTRPPSPGRIRLARRAGYRPHTGWLTTGIGCLALAALLDHFELATVFSLQSPPATVLANYVEFATWLALVGLSLTIVAGLLSRQLGWVDPAARHRLRLQKPVRVRSGPGIRASLGAIGTCMIIFMLLPVVAGATRAVDATPSSLPMLWKSWGLAVLVLAGCACTFLGFLDVRVAARRVWKALHRSDTQVRADRQGQGRT